jgi:hypothetical protein
VILLVGQQPALAECGLELDQPAAAPAPDREQQARDLRSAERDDAEAEPADLQAGADRHAVGEPRQAAPPGDRSSAGDGNHIAREASAAGRGSRPETPPRLTALAPR